MRLHSCCKTARLPSDGVSGCNPHGTDQGYEIFSFSTMAQPLLYTFRVVETAIFKPWGIV
ncbi:hypothetical protein ETA_24950 [Erwinia tasmaniensis Et1/99]|uniref:Uncharacterized protein n=1 Tax=Erwinia tasmaniensis (strain DSM 17950 / CFBP 7177 / CIP 109463 / NCPPB 4357 / Et1/99) TaxID=465817 RepID=B2VIT9_ERWT9|nr:hypothetical protein ETA_24950 [Erwinia tasmaniensis Et1/99]